MPETLEQVAHWTLVCTQCGGLSDGPIDAPGVCMCEGEPSLKPEAVIKVSDFGKICAREPAENDEAAFTDLRRRADRGNLSFDEAVETLAIRLYGKCNPPWGQTKEWAREPWLQQARDHLRAIGYPGCASEAETCTEPRDSHKSTSLEGFQPSIDHDHLASLLAEKIGPKMAWNASAYGEAWTGEEEDTRSLVEDAAEAIHDLVDRQIRMALAALKAELLSDDTINSVYAQGPYGAFDRFLDDGAECSTRSHSIEAYKEILEAGLAATAVYDGDSDDAGRQNPK